MECKLCKSGNVELLEKSRCVSDQWTIRCESSDQGNAGTLVLSEKLFYDHVDSV